MMQLRLHLSALLVSFVPLLGAEDAATSLIEGSALDDFIVRGGQATYSVEQEGVIVGRSAPHPSPNTFLCSKAEYRDFELTFEVLVDAHLNSGVQVRSKSFAEFRAGRVHGPQVEIASNGSAGYIYGEALGTGWLKGPSDADRKTNPFRNGEWNHYRIVAEGPSIRADVNGQEVCQVTDATHVPDGGFIGLQVHALRAGDPPGTVKWRNLRLCPL